jgi:hypothetical protein
MSTSEPGATTTSAPVGYREGLAPNGGDSGAKEQAQEKAQQVAGQAKEQAGQAAGQAKSRARTLVDERSTQAGQQVGQQVSDLRTVGEKLREEGKEGPAKIADQAAERGDKLSRYLQDADADRILQDIEDLGRKSPLAVALGGLTLGFLASRFLKASSSQRYQTRTGSPAPSRPALPRTTPPAETSGMGTVGTGGTPGTTGAPIGRPSIGSEPPRTPEPPMPPTPGRTGI